MDVDSRFQGVYKAVGSCVIFHISSSGNNFNFQHSLLSRSPILYIIYIYIFPSSKALFPSIDSRDIDTFENIKFHQST